MEKLLIAPKSMHKGLLKHYRKEDCFNVFAIYSKEELLSLKFGSLKQEDIIDLMINDSISYINAKVLAKYIPFVNEDYPNYKLHDLFLLHQKYKNKLNSNEYFDQIFENKEILIYGYSLKDQELINLLKDFSYSFVKETKRNHSEILDCQNPLDDTMYMLNSIAKLLSEGVNVNDIFIYTTDELIIQYIQTFGESFGFKINTGRKQALYSLETTSIFLKKYHESQKITESLEFIQNSPNENDQLLLSYINENLVDSFTFSQQYEYLVNRLKEKEIKVDIYSNAVNVISSPIFSSNAYIFVPGFIHGSFPKSYKDNDYLLDEDKKVIGLNDSLKLAQMEEEILIDFFNSNNRFFFSFYSSLHNEQVFVSPLISVLELNIKDFTFPDVIYSKQYANISLSILSDNAHFYLNETPVYKALSKLIKLPYLEYDNQYTTADVFDDNTPLSLSYTTVDKYYLCPFSYYLQKILKIDPFEGNFNSKFGSFAHAIFCKMFDGDFDFDKSFDELFITEDWNYKEKPIVLSLKEQLRDACKASLKHYQEFMVNPKLFLEEPISIKLDEKTTINGFIDKAVILDDKYLMLVDYKTGSSKIDLREIQYGNSMQLTTYALLAKNNTKFNNYQLSGLYINNVINNKLKKENADLQIPTHLKLNGVTVADLESIQSMDKYFITNTDQSSVINKVLFSAKKGLATNLSIISKEELDEYIALTKQKYIEASKKIRNNNFIIFPFVSGKNKNACRYCSYKDICFVKQSQYNSPNDLSDGQEEKSEEEE